MRGRSEWIRLISVCLLLGATALPLAAQQRGAVARSEEHTSELQSR